MLIVVTLARRKCYGLVAMPEETEEKYNSKHVQNPHHCLSPHSWAFFWAAQVQQDYIHEVNRRFARQLPTSVNTRHLLRKQTNIGTTNSLIAET